MPDTQMVKNPKYKKLDTGSVRFSKPTALLITPYLLNGELSDTTLDVVDIVADTISLEQDDPSKETIEHEFSDSPLDENITQGSWTFSATCIDFQNELVARLYGCTINKETVDTSSIGQEGYSIVFPKAYDKLYCLIHIKFDGVTPDVIIPHCLMNSKATLANLKSGVAEGVISGTAQSHEFQITKETDANWTAPVTFVKAGESEGTKNPEAPVFYLGKKYKFRVKQENVGEGGSDWGSEQLEQIAQSPVV